ncbi:MAG: AMP-binding protein [Novosphingobium sp.]|nr:AMP-binding protein [Novosphingobium sp.]
MVGAIEEAIEIGEKSGAKVEIFHLKAAYAPGWGTLMPKVIATIDAARARGVDIAVDMYPYPAGGTGLSITVPTWVFADGQAKGFERLKDPAVRERLKREVVAGSLPGWSNLVEASGGWDKVVLANPFNAKYDRYRNKSIAFIAKELGKHPADTAWDIVLEALPNRAMALFFMMDERDIQTGLGEKSSATERLLRLVLNRSRSGCFDYARWVTGASAAEPRVDRDSEDELAIMYSSGTTGTAKGIVHTHRSRLHLAVAMALGLGIESHSVALLAIATRSSKRISFTHPPRPDLSS